MDSMAINREWSTRPNDERYLTLAHLHQFNLKKKEASSEGFVKLPELALVERDGDIAMKSKASDEELYFNNWSFSQLCRKLHAPADYIRSLPASVAIQPLQYSMGKDEEGSKLLLRKGANWNIACLSSNTYGRIYDADVSGAVLNTVDAKVWKVPSASYAKKDPKRATTLYASDRDMFIALVDDQHPVEVNKKDPLFKGFIVRNSEVGAAAFDFIAFLYRYICDNRIIWGGEELLNVKIRHTSGGPMRFMAEARPMLMKYLESKNNTLEDQVRRATKLELGKTDQDVVAWMENKGWTTGAATAALAASTADAGLNPHSLWGVVQGLTTVAQEQTYNDERFAMERKASGLMKLVVE